MFVGIKIHTVYGTIGNELPPPAIETIRVAYLIDTDNKNEASGIMSDMVRPLNEEAKGTCEPYSSPDSFGWDVVRIVE